MAIYTLETLIKGDSEIVEYYKNAMILWEEIKTSQAFENVNLLAQELSIRQLQFELRCGGRNVGQEIMAIVGIGQFYSSAIGFDDKLECAIRVKNAFAQSYCSIEVKWYAEEAGRIFRLNENSEP